MGTEIMTKKTTEVSRHDYLVVLALFTLARQANEECNKARRAMAKVLGREEPNDLGHVDDAVYTEGGGNLDEALKRESFTVLPE